MGSHHYPDQRISRVAGAIVAIVVSISLGMYMLYDPATVSRGRGPVAIAVLDSSTTR